MERLWKLIESMRPVMSITGLAGGSYRCDKCSNVAANEAAARGQSPVDVQHPILGFSVLDVDLWNRKRRNAVFMYALVAEFDGGRCAIPRYIGVSKATCLRSRWTRLPGSEKHRFKTGSLVHHQRATMARTEREIASMPFMQRTARLCLYGTLVPLLVPLVQRGELHAPRLAGAAVPLGVDEEYSFARGLEEDTADLMESLGLAPWNRTKGQAARSVVECLGDGVWTDPRFARTGG